MTVRIGDRYYHPDSDRRATVIEMSDGTDGRTAIMQYDDGMPVSVPASDVDEEYLSLPITANDPAPSPTLADACVEGEHDFPDDSRDAALGRDDSSHYPRCTHCHLSSSVLLRYLGHSITASIGDICDDCGGDIETPDDAFVDAENRPICHDCWRDYDDTWKMHETTLAEDFAFYDPACGWFSEERPADAKTCPDCGNDRVTIVAKDSSLYENLVRTLEDA